MNQSNKLYNLRKRALKILLTKADKSVPMLIDYQIDDWLRDIHELPPRPAGTMPYEGWMVGGKKQNKTPTKVSQIGLELIKRWEGFRSEAYICPGNVWTIGYGHTVTAKPGMVISKLRGEKLLQSDLERFEKAVDELVKVPLTQYQFDALVSFTFNVGVNAFRNSTLLRLINQGNFALARNEFARWVYANKRKLPGLVNRRKAEASLFGRDEK